MVNVLIVDDEISIRESLKWIMEAEGYDISCAINFKEAKRMINDQSFDVLLINVQLPDGNGLDLIKYKEKMKKNGTVVVITGLPTVSSEILNSLGVIDFLQKPCSIANLKYVVKCAINNQYETE
ncbi:MAG: response regulator [Candidatus Helarchaeota archaeon]